jgi:hypothetical protein
MSVKKGGCPQCGAPIEFRFSSAVQTVCEFCKSILVRRDVDIEKVGKVADLPEDSSPIQLRTEGIYRNKAFWVAGRILYQWEQGGWNEWHLVFQDGQSGWLSDAQAQYAVTFARPADGVPPRASIHPGQQLKLDGTDFEVTTVTRAAYAGVEGELPFEYWDKTVLTFIDLRTRGAQAGAGKFGTIDYSEEPPLLFVGESVEFDDLKLKNLREFEGW